MRPSESHTALGDKFSAPAKLVLLGEYAVLEGAPAIVAAVDRRARGEHVPARAPEQYSEVVQAVLDRGARAGLPFQGGMAIDTSAFFDGTGRKLGLGSSAAVALVAAALLTGRGDERTLGLAIEAHRDAAGGAGSGIDVAASFHGGVIAARRQPSQVVPLASRVGGLQLAVFFTGHSAKTPDLIARCRATPSYARWMKVMGGLADEGLRAWSAQSAPAFLSAVSRYGRAMAGLGKDAGVEIVTPEIEAIMRLADEGRSAAKPSGAGGGDVAVLFTRDPELPASIAARTGMELLDLSVDPRGLSRG